jgi:tetratricopeptide (TPR) repeat protein
VQRYLDGDTVEAGPPSRAYRLRRFARKHRAALATAGAFVLLLIGATMVSTWEAVRATRAEALAEKRLGETKAAQEATQAALKQSEEARRQAEAVSDFLTEVFRSSDPSHGDRDVKVVDLLGRAEDRLAHEFTGSEETRGRLLDTLGQTYLGLGWYDKAETILKKAIAVREAALGPDHPDTLTSRNNLAVAYTDAGRTAEAIALHETTLRLKESKLGPDHPDTLTSRNNLASAYAQAGRTAEAIALQEATLKFKESRLGPWDASTLASRHNLAAAYLAVGRVADAIRLLEANIEHMDSRLGPDHPHAILNRNALAAAYWRAGRLDRSIPLFERALEQMAAKLGPDHPDTLNTQCNLGVNYRDAGRLEEGARLMEEALRRARGRPDALAKTEWALLQLGWTYQGLGRWDRAEPLLRDFLSRQRKTTPPDSPALAATLAQLGLILLLQQDWSEAESALRECLKIREVKFPDDWSRFNTMSQLGGALLGQGRYAEAQPLIVRGYEGLKSREAKIPPPAKARLPEAAERVIELYEAWGQPEQATRWRATLGRARVPSELPADVFARP